MPQITQLTYSELLSLAEGRLPVEPEELSARLASQTYLVEVREGGYDVFFGTEATQRFNSLVSHENPDDVEEISGNTAMGGRVRGTVCLFNWGDDITQAIEGLGPDSILVAGQTRPQLMQLIRGCIGIITDEGGIMSHSAIVARELKMPCVVGTKVATKVLRPGDLIELDADEGKVRLLHRAQDRRSSAPGPLKAPEKVMHSAVTNPKNTKPDVICIGFSEVKSSDLSLVGGKGLNLGTMVSAGLPIPEGFVVTSQVWQAYNGSELPDEVKSAILDRFDELGAQRVAVRSSATAEDSADASWAGQFETILNVTRSQLFEAIQKCWESTLADSVQVYADSQSIGKDQLALAVVVQKMIDSEVSGVAFSVNPVTKNRDEIMIEATYGLGEMLVQGMVTPDNYVVSKDDLRILQSQIGDKDKKMIYDGNANIEVPVESRERSFPCLTDQQASELASLVKNIEDYYGSPQDIEWALADHKFYILQSRPITTL